MAADPHALLARAFAPVDHAYTERDSILYALGLGLGSDPMDPGQLRFIYEDGLAALPMMVNVLGAPGFWAKDPDTGIDWRKVVHAEQSFVLHRPLSPVGRVTGRTRVTVYQDKGAKTGALLGTEREITDAATGETLATVGSVAMLRGDGGTGVSVGSFPPPRRVPARVPDAVCDLPTLPQAALIYRLSGDLNPLHADPAVARAAGFERPILHGLATMGIAGYAILRTLLGHDPARVRAMQVRFTAPVTPGETIRTQMWREGDNIAFRSNVLGRDAVVLDRGLLELATP